jgi:branched-chain amino acid transport system ATP-binding protein
MAVPALLELEGIEVRFGGIQALRGVDVSAAAGEVCGIIGPNGAGKTTLFDVISGVRVPDAGRVTLDGVDLTRTTPTRRAQRGIRRTFQRVQTFGWLSIEDNVLAAIEWHGGGGGFAADTVRWPARRRRERARREDVTAVLDHCGLLAVKDELAASLPTGVARMVELARAIVDRPRLLLLDEPASGLDDTESERLGTQIRRARDELGCSVLLVEHDVAFVMEHSDRVLVLDQGTVLAEGTPEDIQRSGAVREAYLGTGAP